MDLSGKEMGQKLEDFVNSATRAELDAFVAQVTQRAHRTLQQKIMGLVVGLLEAWTEAAQKSRFDARNEATVKLASRMVEATGDKYDRALPLI